MRINLLPKEYRPQPLVNPFRLTLMLVTSILVFCSLVFSIFQYSNLQYNKEQLREVKKQLELLKSTEEKLNQIEQISSNIKKISEEIELVKKEYRNYLDVINNVVISMPNQMWIMDLSINNKGIIVVRGETLDFVLIGDLLKRIEAIQDFKRIKLKKISENKIDELLTYSFEIELSLEEAAKNERKKRK